MVILFSYLKIALLNSVRLCISKVPRCTLGIFVAAFLIFASTESLSTNTYRETPLLQQHTVQRLPFETTVWMMDMSTRLSRYIKNPRVRQRLLSHVYQQSEKVKIPPEIVLAVMHVESLFDPYAISVVGAQGLMQVMPFWKKELGAKSDNLMDMATNIRYGVWILDHYLQIEKGDLTKALARYNGSRGKTWYPERVYAYYEKYWR